jgi:hypothetical protein
MGKLFHLCKVEHDLMVANLKRKSAANSQEA